LVSEGKDLCHEVAIVHTEDGPVGVGANPFFAVAGFVPVRRIGNGRGMLAFRWE
jgi:hypothetical protein